MNVVVVWREINDDVILYNIFSRLLPSAAKVISFFDWV